MSITDETKAKIVKLYHELGTIDQVRNKLKIGRNTISKTLRESGTSIRLPRAKQVPSHKNMLADRNRRLLKPAHVTFSVDGNMEEWARQQNYAFVAKMRQTHPELEIEGWPLI